MNRRTLVQRVAQFAGTLLSWPLLAVGGSEPREAASQAGGLSQQQLALLEAMAETIIPESDAPGARTSGVAAFIDHMVAHWYSERERAAFIDGMMMFRERCLHEYRQTFTELVPEDRLAFLEALDREAIGARRKESSLAGAGPGQLAFFSAVKELTVVGYYTSKAGMAAIGYAGPVGGYLGATGPNRSSVWN
jgi:hypothetical protein